MSLASRLIGVMVATRGGTPSLPVNTVVQAYPDSYTLITDTGDYLLNVLGNDIYPEFPDTPTLTILSQDGPGTADIVNDGGVLKIRVPTTIAGNVIFHDTFTAAADEASLLTHVPDIGTGYAQARTLPLSTPFNFTVVAATDTVRSAVTSAIDKGQGLRIVPAPSSANYRVEIRIAAGTNIAALNPNCSFTLFARYVGTGSGLADYYLFTVWPHYSTGGWHELSHTTAVPIRTELVSSGVLGFPSAGDLFALEVNGTTIRALKNGVLLDPAFSVTNSLSSAIGDAGFGFGAGIDTSSTAALDQGLLLDDFKVTLL